MGRLSALYQSHGGVVGFILAAIAGVPDAPWAED
jgi:hypothetical protein